jgi:hypothetical protein
MAICASNDVVLKQRCIFHQRSRRSPGKRYTVSGSWAGNSAELYGKLLR